MKFNTKIIKDVWAFIKNTVIYTTKYLYHQYQEDPFGAVLGFFSILFAFLGVFLIASIPIVIPILGLWQGFLNLLGGLSSLFVATVGAMICVSMET